MNAPIHTTRSPGHPVGRHWLLTALTALLLLMGCPVVIAAGDDAGSDLPVLSLSVLQFGTAHWELDHLQYRGLDRANGFRLELLPVANLPASRLAVTAGSVNGAVADLLWTQFRYQAGASYLYLPFSSRIGEILVAETSEISSLADLPGKRIGVHGDRRNPGLLEGHCKPDDRRAAGASQTDAENRGVAVHLRNDELRITLRHAVAGASEYLCVFDQAPGERLGKFSAEHDGGGIEDRPEGVDEPVVLRRDTLDPCVDARPVFLKKFPQPVNAGNDDPVLRKFLDQRLQGRPVSHLVVAEHAAEFAGRRRG